MLTAGIRSAAVDFHPSSFGCRPLTVNHNGVPGQPSLDVIPASDLLTSAPGSRLPALTHCPIIQNKRSNDNSDNDHYCRGPASITAIALIALRRAPARQRLCGIDRAILVGLVRLWREHCPSLSSQRCLIEPLSDSSSNTSAPRASASSFVSSIATLWSGKSAERAPRFCPSVAFRSSFLRKNAR